MFSPNHLPLPTPTHIKERVGGRRKSRGVEVSREHVMGGGRQMGRERTKSERSEQESKKERRGQAAPFIVSQAHLTVAR